MSQPVVINYDAPASNFVANAQDVALGSPFLLNGASPYVPIPQGPVFFQGQQRPITFTSTTAASNAGVTLVITGLRMGSAVPIVENLTGPAGNASVTSANQYASITSVVPTVADAVAMSIGTGIGATFAWVPQDIYRAYPSFTIQGVIGGAGGQVSYSVLQTLDSPTKDPATIAGFPVQDSVATPFEQDIFSSFAYPVRGLQLVVNETVTNATGALQFTILQQGV